MKKTIVAVMHLLMMLLLSLSFSCDGDDMHSVNGNIIDIASRGSNDNVGKIYYHRNGEQKVLVIFDENRNYYLFKKKVGSDWENYMVIYPDFVPYSKGTEYRIYTITRDANRSYETLQGQFFAYHQRLNFIHCNRSNYDICGNVIIDGVQVFFGSGGDQTRSVNENTRKFWLKDLYDFDYEGHKWLKRTCIDANYQDATYVRYITDIYKYNPTPVLVKQYVRRYYKDTGKIYDEIVNRTIPSVKTLCHYRYYYNPSRERADKVNTKTGQVQIKYRGRLYDKMMPHLTYLTYGSDYRILDILNPRPEKPFDIKNLWKPNSMEYQY